MKDSMSPILRMRGVSKHFSGTQVLQDVNLDIPRGSIVALLGASGSGKTTILQLIAGLLEPDTGTLTIDDADMRGVPAYLRAVNMMFQSYALFPHLTVAQNVAYGLKATQVARAERERLVTWALDLTRLAGLERRRPDQLSGGQRQRVALARCLVMKPSLLLLDEPMAALDRGLRADVQHELIAIQRAVRTTFVLVTHDQDEAMSMADFIAIVDRGRIVQFGPPRTLYESPASRFVASFLGSVNLFEGTAQRDAQTVRLTTHDGLTVVASSPAHPAGEACAVGFRPEAGMISRSPTGAANEFSGTVESVSYGGNLSHVTVRIGSERKLSVTTLNARTDSDKLLGAGDLVYVAFSMDSAMVMVA